MKAKKLPSGSWRVQVQHDHKRYSFTAKTKREAENKAEEFLLIRGDVSNLRLKEAVQNYIDAKRNVLSPSTIDHYERISKLHFQDIMRLRLKDITSDVIQREINREAVRFSPKTVRNCYGLISATLDMFAPGVDIRVTLPAKKKISYNVPTAEDISALVNGSSGNLKTAIMLAAFCGMRRGEIVALTSEDVSGNTIHVKQCAVYGPNGLEYKQPKTYSSDRYISAPNIVIDQIKEKEGYVCPIGPSAITAEFIRLRKSLGLKCRFHDLRHYYASVLHAIGIPDQYIMKNGGWKSDFMLKAVYRNTLDDMEKKNDSKVNDYFDSIM